MGYSAKSTYYYYFLETVKYIYTYIKSEIKIKTTIQEIWIKLFAIKQRRSQCHT